MDKVVEHETRRLVVTFIIHGGAWRTIRICPRRLSTRVIPPRIEDAPIKWFALDRGPHNVAPLLYVIIDIIFEGSVPEIDPNMFVRVAQADGWKYLHIAGDVFEDHPYG